MLPRVCLNAQSPFATAIFSWAAHVTQLIAAVAALTLIGGVIISVQRGFDFTDDAFYLLSAREPQAISIGASLFGYVLRPLFLLVGGDIANFRRAGIVIACLLAVLAGYAWCSEGRRPSMHIRMAPWLSLIAAMPLFYYGWWLTSPSYNWLLLVSSLLLFAAFGFLARSDTVLLPSLLAALSGVIALFARQPAAVLLALLYSAAVAVTAESWRTFLLRLGIAALTTLCVLIASFLLMIPLGPASKQITAFIDVFMRPGLYGLASWEQMPLFFRDSSFSIVFVCGLAFCAAILHRAWFDTRRVRIAVTVIIIAASAYSAHSAVRYTGRHCHVSEVEALSGFDGVC